MDAAHTARRGVEEFRRDGFRQWVVSFAFPARHKVVTLLGNHAVQGRYLVGGILHVGIHGYDHIALRAHEADVQSRRLAVVARERDAADSRVLLLQFLDDTPRLVGGTVVDKPYFVAETVLVHHALNPRRQLRKRFSLII